MQISENIVTDMKPKFWDIDNLELRVLVEY